MEYRSSLKSNVKSLHYNKIDISTYYNTHTKTFHYFDGVASTICRKLEEIKNLPVTIEKIHTFIQEEFDCTEYNNIQKDILEILSFLEKKGLFEFTPSLNKDNKKISQNIESPSESKILDAISDALIPHSITFEITNNCPLNCIHCYQPTKLKEGWNISRFSKILDKLHEMGTMKLCLTGGECFAHPNIEDFLKIAYNKNFVLSILTNGIFLTKKNVKILASCYPNLVQVSLYAADANTHDSITQARGSFKKTINGIRLLQEVGLTPKIACVVTKKNCHAIHALLNWCESEKLICDFEFNVIPSYNPTKNIEDLTCFQEEWIKDILLDNNFNPSLKEIKQKQTKKACEAGFRSFSLTADGFIVPCSALRLKLGNVFEEKIEKIWNDSPILKEWRKITIDDYPECVNCNARLTGKCKPCRAGYFINTGEYKKIDNKTCNLGKMYYKQACKR